VIRSSLLVLFFIASCATSTESKNAVRAELFLVPWRATTRPQLTANEIRLSAKQKNPRRLHVEVTTNEKLQSVILMLDIGNFPEKGRTCRLDAIHLIVDVEFERGQKKTFVATQWQLFSADGQRCRSIDEGFRSAFSRNDLFKF
jgi:hypothetical protein